MRLLPVFASVLLPAVEVSGITFRTVRESRRSPHYAPDGLNVHLSIEAACDRQRQFWTSMQDPPVSCWSCYNDSLLSDSGGRQEILVISLCAIVVLTLSQTNGSTFLDSEQRRHHSRLLHGVSNPELQEEIPS